MMKKTYTNIYIKPLCSLLFLLIGGISGTTMAQHAQLDQKQDTAKDSCESRVTFGPIERNSAALVDKADGNRLQRNSAYSVTQSLYGMIPGLVVRQGQGEPGNDDASFLVRGVGTFGNTNGPLILVDGFERNIESVALEDIESVSVLKDATAAVLYGNKAANGVIQITTKRGKAGKPRVTTDVTSGLQQPLRLPTFVSSAKYAEMYNQALLNDGLPTLYSQADIDAYRAGNSNLYPNVDWMDEMLRGNAPLTRVNATATGGNQVVKYYASIGYLLQDGLFDHTDTHEGYDTNIRLNRLNFRSNLDIQLMKEWNLKFDIFGVLNDQNTPYRYDAVWTVLNRYPSTIPMYVEPGKLGGTPNYPSNPMSVINEQGYATTRQRYIQTSLSTEYNFGRWIKGLKAGIRFSYDNYYSVKDGWQRSVESFNLLPDHTIGEAIGQNSTLSYVSPGKDDQSLAFNFEGYADYSVEWNGKHRLSVLGLYHQDKMTTSAQTPYKNQSVSGLISYQLRNRYLVDVGLNYAGVERFRKGDRFRLFPSMAAAWVISEEPFLSGSPVVNHLKLRASVGKTGRCSFDQRYVYRDYYTYSGEYYFGNSTSPAQAMVEASLSNPDMTYETALTYNIGADFHLWNRLRLQATYFYEKRENILVSRSNVVPSLVGASLQPANMGKARKSGVELSACYERNYRDGSISLQLNVTRMDSKILYNAELPVPAGSEYNYRSGHAIAQPYGLKFAGFFQSEEEIKNSPVQQFGDVKPGDMKYHDLNNDGVINSYDETAIEKSVYPEWEFGLLIDVTYKRFDLSGLFQAQLGRDIYLGNNPLVYWPLVNDAKISTFVDTPWSEETASVAKYPRLTTQANPNNYRSSDFWYKNADFLRLRSLELGYTLPLAKSDADTPSIRIFLQGNNLFTLSKFSFSDPETYQVGYPAMRSYNIGLNIKF